MKLSHLLENEDHFEREVREWFIKHCMHKDQRIYFQNGKLYHQEGLSLTLDCEEIPYKIENVVGTVDFGWRENMKEKRNILLKSLKNIPESKESIHFGGQGITIVDQPLIAGDRISLAKNELTTLKNIHKFVKCKEITVWNNPIKSGFLDLMKIPGLVRIDSGVDGVLDNKFKDSHLALSIVSKYFGKGKAGILEAQQELMDNDLEDYE